jgi:hypothetical protein
MARTTPQLRVRLPLSENPDARFAGVPAHNVTLRVDYVAAGSAASPRFTLHFFRGAETAPSLVTELGDGDETSFEHVRYLVKLDHDVRLRAQVSLWWLLAAAGWTIVAASAVLLALVRPIWIHGRIVSGARAPRLMVLVDALAGERETGRDAAGILLMPNHES